MTDTPNLEAASNGGFLWPFISDAVDTFLRRRLNSAEPYERLWRLIHVWEATEITLAVAAVANVAETFSNSELFRRLREFLYGHSWDQIARSFRVTQGAADGSIDQWINILEEVAKTDSLEGQYLPSLRGFLDSDGINLSSLATQWGRACDVPPELKKGTFRVRHAMRHVNSLRNRLAHVPFPHDPLADLADALEAATEQLFGTSPSPGSHAQDGRSNPLTGALRVGRSYWHGTQFQAVSDSVEGALRFAFPCTRKLEGVELWNAANFVHVDAMMRPHLLTRVKGLDVCEFTRFKAEASAIFVREASGFSARVPRPTQAEYKTEEEDTPAEETAAPTIAAEAPVTTMSGAVEAIRLEDYERALAFFEQLVVRRPDYHIAWLRLGHIRREQGVRLIATDKVAAEQLLLAAIADLQTATAHRDPEYRALAQYELSKAYYHLARIRPDDADVRTHSYNEALAAFASSNEKKYQSWCEHIEEYAPWRRSPTAQVASGGELLAEAGKPAIRWPGAEAPARAFAMASRCLQIAPVGMTLVAASNAPRRFGV